MKILLVTEYYPPHIGGVEVVFSTLAQGMVKHGHECHVITCKLPNTRGYEEIEGVRIHRVRVPSRADRYWFTILAIPEVLKLAKRVDLIHTTTFNAALPAWLVSKLLRKKCIITVHEVWGPLWASLAEMNWFSARLHQFLERVIILSPFDKYVCVSKYTHNCLRLFGVREEKLAVVYNGVDHELFSPERVNSENVKEKLNLNGEFVYMYYGRPGVTKGVEYLVQAIPMISQAIPNSKALLILADDPRDRYENIKKMIKDLKIEDEVILLDPVPRKELPDYIAASDCVVVPSLSEGFGFTAAEACAMGKAVVASNVASLPEVVSGKYVLVEPRNPKAIAEGVEKTYKGDVENIDKKVFAWDECVERYLKIYTELENDTGR